MNKIKNDFSTETTSQEKLFTKHIKLNLLFNNFHIWKALENKVIQILI